MLEEGCPPVGCLLDAPEVAESAIFYLLESSIDTSNISSNIYRTDLKDWQRSEYHSTQ
jgi:hypothetical protein